MRLVNLTDAKSYWDRSFDNNSLQVPFLTYAWHTLWHEILATAWQPYVLVNETITAPLARQGNTVIFSGGEDLADYLDIIGPTNQKNQFLHEMAGFLVQQGITKIELHNVPQNSPTLAFFQNNQTIFNATIEIEDSTPIIQLPKSYDIYISHLTHKHRHELRRKIRKIVSNYPNITVNHTTELENGLEALLFLMKKNHNKALFLTPQTEAFFRRLIFAFKDTIEISTISENNQYVASTLAFKTNKSYLLYNSGYDFSYSGISLFLKASLIQETIKQHFEEFNFLQGRERYKYELGGKDFFVYKITAQLKN